jgi:hypothetical protein
VSGPFHCDWSRYKRRSRRYLHSAAAVPITTQLSGTWHVKVDKGSKKVLGRYVPALQMSVRCESQAINSKGETFLISPPCLL